MLDILNKAHHLIKGKNAEDRAQDYLIAQGLKPVCRNYRCKQGELDLVMTELNTLVIVEVRYRKSDTHGSALESITPTKQTRIIAATQHYLAAQKRIDSPIRFDVVAFSGSTNSVNWIKNAF